MLDGQIGRGRSVEGKGERRVEWGGGLVW